LRAASPSEEREPLAAKFVLTDRDGDLHWKFYRPDDGEVSAVPGVREADVQALGALDPEPTSQRDVKQRLGWGSTRALDVLTEWRRRGAPRSPTSMWGAREQSNGDAPGALPEHSESLDISSPGITRGAEHYSVLPAPHTGGKEQGALPCTVCGDRLHPTSHEAGTHPGCEAA